jgi:hypothetical protein
LLVVMSETEPRLEGAGHASVPAGEAQKAELEAAIGAFTDGDFAGARRRLGALRKMEPHPTFARHADELDRRTSPDPLALWVLAGAALLFLAIVYLTYLR